MLRTRLLTVFLLLPLLLALFRFGSLQLIAASFYCLYVLCLLEFSAFLFPAIDKQFNIDAPAKKNSGFLSFIVLVPCIFTAIFYVMAFVAVEADFWAMLIGAVPVCLLSIVFYRGNISAKFSAAICMGMAMLYLCIPWIVLLLLVLAGDGPQYVLLVLAITWSGDTGAYFGGRFFGHRIFRKSLFAPQISPKKTWEGAIFGIVGSVLGAFLINNFYNNTLLPIPLLLVAAIVGGFAGQMGDLVESLFKRFSGVKDSGKIIPGHGGLLDRIDAVLFVAPVIYALISI